MHSVTEQMDFNKNIIFPQLHFQYHLSQWKTLHPEQKLSLHHFPTLRFPLQLKVPQVDAAKSSVLSVSFFGVLRRLYNLFSSSVQCWAVLKEHVKQLTFKPLSTTRWEAWIDCVKVVRYQLPEILDALSALQTFAIEKGDSETMSTAKSLHGELNTWSFLPCTMTWYNVLYQINHVSKLLQSPNVSMETLRSETEGVKEYLEDFRGNGIGSCQTDAKDIAENLDMEMTLPEKRQCKNKRQSLYEGTEETVPFFIYAQYMQQQYLQCKPFLKVQRKLSLLQTRLSEETSFCTWLTQPSEA